MVLATVRQDLEANLRREVVDSIRFWQRGFKDSRLLDNDFGILSEYFGQDPETFKRAVLQGEVGYRLAHELLEDFEITDKTTHAITYTGLWMEVSATMIRQFESLFDSFEVALGRPPTEREIEKYISLIFLIQRQQLTSCLSDSSVL